MSLPLGGNLALVRKLLLGSLLFCSCSGLPTQPVARQAAPPVEFVAQLSGADERYPVEISTKKKRFRLEREGKLFLGSLDPEQREVLVVDPKARTFFRADPKRFSQLFDTHDRPAATRFDGAINQVFAAGLRDRVLFPFQSPCEAVGTTGSHQECLSAPTSGGLVIWTHKTKRITSPQDGLRKIETSVQYTDNPELGVLVGGPQNSIFFEQVEVKELPEDRFTVPDSFREMLSDEELRDPRFGYLGGPKLFPESQWTEFMEFERDIPPPPGSPMWTFQTEKWQEKGDGPSREMVWLDRLYSHRPFDPSKLPPGDGDHAFANLKAWDPKAEAGTHSFREGPLSLVFTTHDQVFRIKVLNETMADQIPVIAKALEERARRDQALGKKKGKNQK